MGKDQGSFLEEMTTELSVIRYVALDETEKTNRDKFSIYRNIGSCSNTNLSIHLSIHSFHKHLLRKEECIVVKNTASGYRIVWLRISAMLLPRCVVSSELLNLSMTTLPHL